MFEVIDFPDNLFSRGSTRIFIDIYCANNLSKKRLSAIIQAKVSYFILSLITRFLIGSILASNFSLNWRYFAAYIP
jgi:hypothetical protein